MPLRKLSRRRFLQLTGAVGGGVAVASLAGYAQWNAIDALPDQLSPFSIEDLPASADTPILILRNSNPENPFDAYLAEILRAEGILSFSTMNWDEVGDLTVERFGVILLAEGNLDTVQAERLSAYVFQGGQLISFRPDARLMEVLGLERLPGGASEGYLQVDVNHALARGAETRAVQFHGTADYYRLAGAECIAWLADANDLSSDYPAVTINAYGDGQAAGWSFDLARSVVYSRQGNPEWADQERDGRDGIRAVDAYVGWVDLERLEIPQADEQMRLLSRMITEMLMDRLPLPRLGYFPAGKRGVLIATGDSHRNSPQTIEKTLGYVERFGGQMSIYYTPEDMSKLRRLIQRGRAELANVPVIRSIVARNLNYPTPEQVAEWRRRRHEFGMHPYVENGLEAAWHDYMQSFIGFGYGPVPPTVRTHRILWSGWVETARVQAAYGIRMNMDLYQYGTAFQKASGEWCNGFTNASGLPMKYIDEQGRLLNIYQQDTQLVDEHLMKVPWGGGWANLSANEAVQVAERVLQRAAAVGAAIAAQYHVDPFAFEENYVSNAERWMEGSLGAAADLGFPIISAESWLRFTETRQQARMTDWSVDPSTNHLAFTIDSTEAPQLPLMLMLPLNWNNARVDSVLINASPISLTPITFSGVEYVWLPVPAGKRQVTVQYQSFPA